MSRLANRLLIVISICASTGYASEPAQTSPTTARRVMTWVPPYAVEKCRKTLALRFQGIAVQDGVTHVGLQFWDVAADGTIAYVDKFRSIDDKTVESFRRWGRSHKIKISLCIYNGVGGWDWSRAHSAFSGDRERKRLVEALASETRRLDLDGVDVDFEGKGRQDASKDAYVAFIRELSLRLRAEGKELTLDSFAYKWNAPNQSWWPQLLPHVDAIHVMGYAETGAKAADWRSYAAMKVAGGKFAHKLAIGMPANVAKWQGQELAEQLQWLVNEGTMGLAVWDAQLPSPEWRTHKTWQAVRRIKTPGIAIAHEIGPVPNK